MKDSRYRFLLFAGAVIMFIMAIATESLFFSSFEYRYRTRLFNNKVAEREKILENCLEAMKPILAGKDHHGSVTENNLFTIAEQNRITILEYLDNQLVNWSDNSFSVPQVLADSVFSEPLIFLQNGWFLTKTIQNENEKIVGLLRLRTDYGFENDIIKSGFEKDFRVTDDVGFSVEKADSDFHITDSKGNFLFSLIFPDIRKNTYFVILPLLLLGAFFALLILLVLSIVKYFAGDGKEHLAVILGISALILIYFVFLFAGTPSILKQTEFFSPYRISFNVFIPTLGHLLLLGIIACCSAWIFYKYYPVPVRPLSSGISSFLTISGLFICIILLLSFASVIFNQLVVGSGINFETYKVLKISLMSIAAYSGILLLMSVPVIILLKVVHFLNLEKPDRILLPFLTSLPVPVFLFYNDLPVLLLLLSLYILLNVIMFSAVRRRSSVLSLSVIFSLLFGLFTLFIISFRSEEKTTENLKIQAISFSTENDPEAEHLLLDLWNVIKSDSVLSGMMNVEYFDKIQYEKVSDYLQSSYFRGYWRNFTLNLVLCRNDESLRIGPGNDVFENCFSFFDERIKKNGHRLTGTDFFFLDNQGGRSYYVGKLLYRNNINYTNGLFIELYSDVNVFQEGYSELLLDKKFHGYSGLKDYSFAKYINGEVVLRTGDFPYNISDTDYLEGNEDFRFFSSDGFKHVLYKNGNSTVIISRHQLTIADLFISFAYLFAYILLFCNVLILIGRRPHFRNIFNFSFRQKLQFSFIGVLLFSFILVGAVVVTFTVNQYQIRHTENLKDKLNSIYLEIESKLAGEKFLSSAWSASGYPTLNDLLIKFSNIFKTDINLYDMNGFLIGTSRPEIFSRDLISERINNMALINLKDFTKTEYYQKEKIGNLEFTSAYVPFFNIDNKAVAYLNLPYFRMQSVLAREISNMMVAVINFALLFIVITMSIAVFISGRLTAPLTMLGGGLASVGVGKKSEHLDYKGTDEIGELVRQYNRMVDEIEESSLKLANSEREYAWREMAKQIAHEIKNPLTPMKLNVQHLLKSWKDKAPGFDSRIESFTSNQIEYIDNLSSIATSFSSFAKMPGSKPAELNLIDQLKTTLELFSDTDNVTFKVNWPHESKVIVYADKEHLNGVFSNLFKNGIQSVPTGRSGLITVNLEVRSNKVIVAITDNGSGIPEELKNKMFIPNFTTKSSGMGLGLSIVKKYLESAEGKIWFESVADEGTTFFVELPLKYTVEKPGETFSVM